MAYTHSHHRGCPSQCRLSSCVACLRDPYWLTPGARPPHSQPREQSGPPCQLLEIFGNLEIAPQIDLAGRACSNLRELQLQRRRSPVMIPDGHIRRADVWRQDNTTVFHRRPSGEKHAISITNAEKRAITTMQKSALRM